MIQIGANFSTLGVPETGLSPTITIRDTSDGSVVINGVGMTEVGGGAYKYNFSNDTAKKYSAVIDGGVDTLDSRYMTAWSERAKAEAEIVDVLGDTNELQGNQGNWLTATGFATENPPSQNLADYKATGFSTHNPAAVKIAMEAVGTKLTTVKTQTDKMHFSGDNIKSRVETIASAAVDSIHDEVVEGALTSRQIQMLILSFIAGETTGGGTTSVIFKNQAGDKQRISMTVNANGDRSATVVDIT